MAILKWSLIAVALLATLVLVAYLWGRSLPPEHVAEGSREIAAKPEAIATWVRDVAAHPTWRRGVSRIEILEQGAAGLRYREHGAHGAITFRLSEPERDRAFESEIDDADLPFGGRWRIRIEPAGAHSIVTIREEGVVRPPLFRFLSRYAFGHATTLNQYLDALVARAPAAAEAPLQAKRP